MAKTFQTNKKAIRLSLAILAGLVLGALFGLVMPEWFVFGLFPCIIVNALHFAPFAYILIGGILQNMDATLEESATILKTSRGRIIRKITLPIIMPAVLSTFLLVFSSGFASYAVPVFLGGAVLYPCVQDESPG